MYFIPTDYSGYFIVIILILMAMTLPSQKISYDIYRGKIPKFIKDFPLYVASEEDITLTKNKISEFIEFLNSGIEANLDVTQNDINNLYTQGELLNLLMPGSYMFYEISDLKII